MKKFWYLAKVVKGKKEFLQYVLHDGQIVRQFFTSMENIRQFMSFFPKGSQFAVCEITQTEFIEVAQEVLNRGDRCIILDPKSDTDADNVIEIADLISQLKKTN